MRFPIKILFCTAVSVAFLVVVYPTGIYVWKHLHPDTAAGAPPSSHREPWVGGTSEASRKPLRKPSPPDSDAAPKSAYQVPQMYEADEYSRLYSEQGLSLLPSDATNLTPEAVTRADDWKRAGDWDQGLLRMNETFNASLDPASALAVPAFQVPAFTVPAVQMPAVPACCDAP